MANPKPQWAYRMGGVAAAAAASTLPFSASNIPADDSYLRVSAMSQAASPSRPPLAATSPTAYVEERLVDAKLDAVEARTETKFAQLMGEIKLISASIGTLSSDIGKVSNEVGEAKAAAASGKTYVIGTGIALAGFFVGMFAYGWQIVDVVSSLAQGAK